MLFTGARGEAIGRCGLDGRAIERFSRYLPALSVEAHQLTSTSFRAVEIRFVEHNELPAVAVPHGAFKLELNRVKLGRGRAPIALQRLFAANDRRADKELRLGTDEGRVVDIVREHRVDIPP